MQRYKGVLYLTDTDRRVVIQRVNKLGLSQEHDNWGDRKPFSKIVFIGRILPEEAIKRGLATCLD